MNTVIKEQPNRANYSAVQVPLSFTVSVTGHRNICSAENVLQLRALVASLLGDIRQCCLALEPGTKMRLISALAAGADQIAAAAIVANGIDENNNNGENPNSEWNLHVVLPFDKTSYIETLHDGLPIEQHAACYTDQFDELLASASRVYELADRSANAIDESSDHSRYWRNERFRTLGEILSRQSDLLLALWDGESGGGAGGTTDVVRIALAQGKPVLRIDPGTLDVSYLLPDQGRVDPITLARHPKWGPAKDTQSLFSPDGAVNELASSILLFPGVGQKNTHLLESASSFFGVTGWGSTNEDVSADLLEPLRTRVPSILFWSTRFKPVRRFIAGNAFPERTTGVTRWCGYKWLENLVVSLQSKRHDLLDERSGNEKKTVESQSESPKEALAKADLGRFMLRVNYAEDDWSQAVKVLDTDSSKHSADKQRSSQLVDADSSLRKVMVSTDAIATYRGHVYRTSYVINFLIGALAVVIGLLGLFSSDHKYVFVLIELLLLVFLIAFYNIARYRSWHRRWLNARHITESLRAGRFLVWMGFGGRRSLKQDVPWTAWYTNAVMASTLLPDAVMTENDIRDAADELKQHVDHQISYHKLTADKLREFHHGLDIGGRWCLLASIFMAAAYVMFFDPYLCFGWSWCTDDGLTVIKYIVTVVCAGGPVLAGALMGIRYQGDFERFSERSQETMEQLQRINTRLIKLSKKQPDVNEKPLFEELIGVVVDLLNVYEADLEDWRYVYAARPNPDVG